MAKLIACKDCGNQISKKADKCPHCGAKNKQTSIVTWLAAIFIGIPFLIAIFSSASNSDNINNNTIESDVSPSETLEAFEFHEPNFDKHAGAAITVAQMFVKKGMKNPDSVEFRNMSYVKASRDLPATVCGEVTGKNNFNAYGEYKRFFLVTDKGLYSIDDNTPEFNEAYNGFCTLK